LGFFERIKCAIILKANNIKLSNESKLYNSNERKTKNKNISSTVLILYSILFYFFVLLRAFMRFIFQVTEVAVSYIFKSFFSNAKERLKCVKIIIFVNY